MPRYAPLCLWTIGCAIVFGLAYPKLASHGAEGEDIFCVFSEGKHLVEGVNPYARTLSAQMDTNDKYATYFPASYIASAITQKLGFREFPSWLAIWRLIFATFHFATGILLYVAVWRARGSTSLAMFCSGCWLFNRWSLVVLQIAHLEPVALFFLTLAVVLLDRRPVLAWIAFGLSLSFKQLGLFALPVLLIEQWRLLPLNQPARSRKFAYLVLAGIALPLVLALPFVIIGPVAFAKSMLINATRHADFSFTAPSLDVLVNLKGLLARIPVLFLLFLVYWSFHRGHLHRFAAIAAAMLAFIWFNPVFFRQYMVWSIPFALLTLAHTIPATSSRRGQSE